MNPSLKVALGYEVDQSTINKVTSNFEEMGRKMQAIGGAMSLAVTTPLVLLGKNALQMYSVQAKAVAQVEAGLKSTGNAVGYTSTQLKELANDIQSNSLFGDEVILKDVTAQLLTFTNIAGEQFARTQQAAADLATRLDGDLKGASIQLGKALNDPIANLSALSRSGIQFSESQKATIKSMVETNRLADAQTIILDELEKQYGGSAKAAAEAGSGWITQLNNDYGDLLESFGDVINEGLKPLGESLRGMVGVLKALSPEVKRTIVIVTGLVAAIGPLLLGAGTLIRMLPLLKSGFMAMRSVMLAVVSPAGLVVAAIAALVTAIVYVRDNMDAFKERFLNTWITIRNGFIDVIKAIVKPYTYLADLLGLDIGKTAVQWLDDLKGKTKEATTEFGSLGRAFKNTMKDLGIIDNAASSVEPSEVVNSSIAPNVDVKPVGVGGLKALKEKINFGVVDAMTIDNPTIAVNSFKSGLDKILQGVTPVTTDWVISFANLFQVLKDNLEPMVQSAGSAFVDLAFNLGAGMSKLKDIPGELAKIVGAMLKEAAKMLIVKAITDAIRTGLGDVTAIFSLLKTVGLGVGLAAAGGLMSNLSGSSNSSYGAANYGTINSGSAFNVNVTGKLVGQGTDLVAVIQETNTMFNG